MYARQDGLFEPSAEIGEDIDAGQTAGWIHKPEAPWEDATEVVFPITATVLCKHPRARATRRLSVSTWQDTQLRAILSVSCSYRSLVPVTGSTRVVVVSVCSRKQFCRLHDDTPGIASSIWLTFHLGVV